MYESNKPMGHESSYDSVSGFSPKVRIMLGLGLGLGLGSVLVLGLELG